MIYDECNSLHQTLYFIIICSLMLHIIGMCMTGTYHVHMYIPTIGYTQEKPTLTGHERVYTHELGCIHSKTFQP